jgi:hypothetical protein
MDDAAIECSAEWWIHHGKNHARQYPDPFDHRQFVLRLHKVFVPTPPTPHPRYACMLLP